MPFSGDGTTIWHGGSLNVIGAPPGSKAQIVDKNNLIIAEAVVGFNGLAQFFRPPDCNFPVGWFPGLRLLLSAPDVRGPVVFPAAPLPAARDSFAFPLFINSQNWAPSPYKGPHFNNVLLNGGGEMAMQCSRVNAPTNRIMPPPLRLGFRPRL
jgi:hypothetical protein